MSQRSNWTEFQSILNRHGIKKLYHFTDRDNLESIIKFADEDIGKNSAMP